MCKTSRISFLDPECMMHVAIEFSQVKNTRRMESLNPLAPPAQHGPSRSGPVKPVEFIHLSHFGGPCFGVLNFDASTICTCWQESMLKAIMVGSAGA